jgi:hypothetical protein
MLLLWIGFQICLIRPSLKLLDSLLQEVCISIICRMPEELPNSSSQISASGKYDLNHLMLMLHNDLLIQARSYFKGSFLSCVDKFPVWNSEPDQTTTMILMHTNLMLMTNIMSELRHLIKPWRWVGQSFQIVKRFQSFFGNSDTLMITCCLFGSKRRCCQSVWYDKHYLDQPLDRVVWIWTCLVLPSSKLLDSLLQEVCFLGKSVISSVLNADDSEIIDSKSTTLGPDVPHAA